MKDIRCPKCGTVFQVDDNDYAAIVAQVRNNEFDKEIARREAEVAEKFDARQESSILYHCLF